MIRVTHGIWEEVVGSFAVWNLEGKGLKIFGFAFSVHMVP